MPQSGSYFYPQVQVPNSSYPSVDMREVAAPAGSPNIGKLFVSASAGADTNSLFYVDDAGNVVNIEDAAGGIFSSSLYVSGTLELGVVPNAAALPAGSDKLSGSILWIEDQGLFGIYGSQGWVQVVTGSVIS